MRSVAAAVLLLLGGARAVAGQSGELYGVRCASCHLPSGTGAVGLSPPLTGVAGRYARSEEGRAYLIRVVRYGLSGPIETARGTFVGLMPPVQDIEDGEIADVLNYVLMELDAESLPADFEPLTAAEVAASTARPLSPGAVAAARRDLTGRAEVGTSEAPPHGSGASRATETAESPPRMIRTVADDRLAGPELHYISQCRGCHGTNGMGSENVPRLAGSAGYFAHTPAGRAFLVRVPGVARAPLSDRELAELLNWMLYRFSAAQLPADFRPYTEEEVARHRADALARVSETRARVVGDLERRGILPPGFER